MTSRRPARARTSAVAALLATGALLVGVSPVPPAGAAAAAPVLPAHGTGDPDGAPDGDPDGGLGSLALARADVALAGDGGLGPDREDVTLALRDVFTARPTMTFMEGVRAGSLLARPTDGRRDTYGDGYRTPSRRTCGPNVCVHAVEKGRDAPPDRAWVRTVRDVMEEVWDAEIDRLGYRRPPTDGKRGGDGRFDVYLKDLGTQGLFGYCAPERRTSPGAETASSYCVLDDDFARSQYERDPMASLRVTAAHEFFHAVQFGYDVKEDPWILESTAMWMEDQVADDVDDNRTYLRYGQVKRPGRPLDLFATDGYDQYGNWAFWQHLSQRFGPGIVHDLWDRLAATPGSANRVSIGGLRSVLREHGGLPTVFARYAAANLDPATTYEEGASWPHAGPARTTRLGAESSTARTSVRVDHLASHSVAYRRGEGVGDGARLRLAVDGPAARTSPAVLAVVETADGDRLLRPVTLGRKGRGTVTVPFGGDVDRVTLTLANVSTRYDCDAGNPSYACRGVPLDEGLRFSAVARLVGPSAGR